MSWFDKGIEQLEIAMDWIDDVCKVIDDETLTVWEKDAQLKKLREQIEDEDDG